MFKFGEVFENKIYEQMQKELTFQPEFSPQQTIAELEQQILLNTQHLPLKLTHEILEQIDALKDIFKIIFLQPTQNHPPIKKNIFGIIKTASTLISELNSPSPKGAIKILYNKSIQIANNIIDSISTYYQNCTIKIFKYM